MEIRICAWLLLQQLLLYGFIHVSCGTFKTADFSSKWLELWVDKTRLETSRVVPHGLLETPLLVDVQVKVGTDGTIFQAAGHIIQNNDLRSKTEQISSNGCVKRSSFDEQPYGQSGVIYAYNDRVVRVTAIVNTLNRHYGRCKYTADLPEVFDPDANDTMTYRFRIRAWKSSSLPVPSLNKTGKISDRRSFVFDHGFQDYPELVISRLKFIYTLCTGYRDFYADSLGAAIKGMSPGHTSERTGFVVYEYNKQSIHVWAPEHVLAASDGIGTEARIGSGVLEVYAWNSSTLKSSMTEEKDINIQPEKISTAPGMQMDNATKLRELFNQSVEIFGAFMNTSLRVGDVINSSMTLSQILNHSVTVGELIDRKYWLNLITSEEISTIGGIIRKSEEPRKFLDGSVTLTQLIDNTVSLQEVIDTNISFIPVLNKTLSMEIPFDDAIPLSQFLDKAIRIVSIVNDSFIKESFEYFQFLDESVKLEELIRNDVTVIARLLKISKTTRTLKRCVTDFGELVNDAIKSAQLLNDSIQEGKHDSKNQKVLLKETENVVLILDEIVIAVSHIQKSVLLSERMITDTNTLGELFNETVTVRSLVTVSVSNASVVAETCDDMVGFTADNPSLQHLGALNETVIQSVLLGEEVITKVEEIINETIAIFEMLQSELRVQNDTLDQALNFTVWQKTFLEIINKNDTLEDLVNSSVTLKDVMNSFETFGDMGNVGDIVKTFLNNSWTVLEVLNGRGNTASLVELLKDSNESKITTSQYTDQIGLSGLEGSSSNIFLRGLTQSYNNEHQNMRTTGSGTLLWYDHIIVPTLCSFGGVIYGLISDTVSFWYPNKYPECSEMCLEETELTAANITTATAIVKIWHLDSDECIKEPCKHGGRCTDLQQSYTCSCADGWTGDDCSVNINECDAGLCKHSVECIDRLNDYTCICKQGWAGKNCQLEIDEETACPRSWIRSGNGCYYFSTKQMTFEAAFEDCENKGHLLEIDDKAENEFVKTELKTRRVSSWISLTRKNKRPDFVWYRTGKTLIFEDWYPGQLDVGPISENCKIFDHIRIGWHDVYCSLTYRYICEATAEATPFRPLPEELTNLPESRKEEINNIQTLMVLGTPAFDITKHSSIQERFTCSKYSLYIERMDNSRSVFVGIIWGITYYSRTQNSASCTIHWGDGLSDDAFIRFDADTFITHIYEKYGIYDITSSCNENDQSLSRCPEVEATCSTSNNLLDDYNNNIERTKKMFAQDYIEVGMSNDINLTCHSPTFNWRLVHVSGSQLISFTDFIQPMARHLTLEPWTLTPGIYVVILEVVFSEEIWLDDLIVLEIILPELFTYILGANFLYVPHGEIVSIDARLSRDPVGILNSTYLSELEVSWAFEHTNTVQTDSDIYTLMKTKISKEIIGTPYRILRGSINVLEVNTSLFPVNSYGIAVFKMSDSYRSSTYFQVIRFVDNVLRVMLSCVYNCNVTHGGIIKYDKITLDTNLTTMVPSSSLKYMWKIYEWDGHTFNRLTDEVAKSDCSQSSLTLPKNVIAEGSTYLIAVNVSTSYDYFPATLSVLRTFDYMPFGGTCFVDKDNVTSALEWIRVICQSWKVRSERLTHGGAIESRPMLSYIVYQQTKNALIEKEPITYQRERQISVMLKVGNPKNNYNTSLIIRILDMYNNYKETVIPGITSRPVLNTDDVSAEQVRDFTDTTYASVLKQLTEMNETSAIVNYISNVCSNIYLIQLPQFEPGFSPVLNDNGNIVDLNQSGNKKVGPLKHTLQRTFNQSLHPATYALRDLLENMTDVMNVIAKRVSHEQQSNKKVSSLAANAFTNLAGKPEFLDKNIMADIIDSLESTGMQVLDVDDIDMLQEAADETFTMSMVASSSSILDSLDQYRSTEDIKDAMKQIDDMLTVVGHDINIYDSFLSPQERSLIFLKMQRLLILDIDNVKKNAQHAANSTINIARTAQDKIVQCNNCSNRKDREKQLLKKTNACMLRDEMSYTKTSSFKFDNILDVNDNRSCEQEVVSVSAFEFEENVFMYDDDGMSSLVTSKILRLDVKTSNKRTAAGYIIFEQKVASPDAVHVVPHVDDEDASEFIYHRFLYQRNTENVCIIVKPLAYPNFTDYLVYIKFNSPPSIIDFDIKTRVVEDKQWYTCIEPHRMKGHTGITFLAIQLPGIKKVFNYSLTITTMSCLTWEEEARKWNSGKCQLMKWLIREERIECLCRQVTDMVFGNSFFVAPNGIDFSTVFLKFSPLNQAAVLGTLAGIFVIYIISVVRLSRLDRQDKLKWGITPLRDNSIADSSYYIIKVETGMRRGAGTRSRVAFILSGDYDHSGRREMFDGVRETFNTGSVMSFLMSTSGDLGDLQNLQIWHDNSGEGSFASWYLNKVDVYDVKRQKTYYFVAETWLSLEKGLEAHLSSNPTHRPIKFESRFFGHIRHGLSESHMLISIFYRPRMSNFTRVQRVSCAVVFIMLNMIASALYFNPEPNYVSPAIFELGPLRFTPQQIYISFVCALITTLPTCLLVVLFKRIKGRPERSEATCSNCYTCCLRCRCTRATGNPYKPDKQRQYNELLKSKIISQDFKNGRYLPHCFVYFAWLIVLGGTLASAFFVVLFSMEWGQQKSEEWLTTLAMSFLESVLLVDPIMVFFVSLLLAVIVRSRTGAKEENVTDMIGKYKKSLGKGDNTVSSSVIMLKSIVTEFRSYMSAPRKLSMTLNGEKLLKAREKHRQYRDFIDSLKDLLLNLILIILVSAICYSNRDDRSFLHHSQMYNRLVEPRGSPKFHTIKTHNDLINWLNYTAIPYLFLEHDDHGTVLPWTERQFTNDYIHFRLGPPRLRQLRTRKGTCTIPYVGRMSCYGEYVMWNENDEDYCLGWKQFPCSKEELAYNVSSSAWTFTSAFDTWGLPLTGYYTTYGGGGYIATLHVNLNYSIDIINELYKKLWMDRQTRAVIVEFTLYNAATNIFVYNIFMVEFPETGGVFTSFTTYPVRVNPHHGPTGTLTIVCEVLFVIYIIVLFAKICLRIFRQRRDYFVKFWRVYDIVLFLVSVTAIVLFVIRLRFSFETIKKFKRDKKLFVNFSHIVFWDQLLVFSLGMLAFLSTVRMLDVFSTLKKVRAIVEIFKKCGKDLFWYGLTFVQVFVGFCVLALLLFGSRLESYRNAYQCMGTLFVTMIGKSKFTEIEETQPILAKIFFMLYVLLVVYFILTIFLSILGASIDQVVQGNRKRSEYDLITCMIQQLKTIVLKLRPKRYAEDAQENDLGTADILLRRRFLFGMQRISYDEDTYQVYHGPTQEEIDAKINRKRIPKKRNRKGGSILNAT